MTFNCINSRIWPPKRPTHLTRSQPWTTLNPQPSTFNRHPTSTLNCQSAIDKNREFWIVNRQPPSTYHNPQPPSTLNSSTFTLTRHNNPVTINHHTNLLTINRPFLLRTTSGLCWLRVMIMLMSSGRPMSEWGSMSEGRWVRFDEWGSMSEGRLMSMWGA